MIGESDFSPSRWLCAASGRRLGLLRASALRRASEDAALRENLRRSG